MRSEPVFAHTQDIPRFVVLPGIGSFKRWARGEVK